MFTYSQERKKDLLKSGKTYCLLNRSLLATYGVDLSEARKYFNLIGSQKKKSKQEKYKLANYVSMNIV